MTIHLPIAAGIGIEGIIWLIILIFWGIAQAVQKSRSTRRPGGPAAPGSPRAPESTLDDELREMLEQLAGRPSTTERGELPEEIELEEAPTPPPPPPPPRAKRPSPPLRRDRRSPAQIEQPPMPAPRPAPAIEPVASTSIPDMAAMISAEDFAVAKDVLRSGLNAAGVSVRMKGMNFKGIAVMPFGDQMTRRGQPLLTLSDLRDERQLRRAILAKAILDPPRGLVPYGRAPSP